MSLWLDSQCLRATEELSGPGSPIVSFTTRPEQIQLKSIHPSSLWAFAFSKDLYLGFVQSWIAAQTLRRNLRGGKLLYTKGQALETRYQTKDQACLGKKTWSVF